MDLQKYLRMKREVEKAERERQNAKGALDLLLETLKRDFGCESLEEGDKLLASIEEKKRELESNFDAQLREYEKEYRHVLE